MKLISKVSVVALLSLCLAACGKKESAPASGSADAPAASSAPQTVAETAPAAPAPVPAVETPAAEPAPVSVAETAPPATAAATPSTEAAPPAAEAAPAPASEAPVPAAEPAPAVVTAPPAPAAEAAPAPTAEAAPAAAPAAGGGGTVTIVAGPRNFDPIDPNLNISLVKAKPGDTISWTNMSTHNTKSLAVPDGAAQWEGKLNENFHTKLTTPGAYVYVCVPHASMGMVGVILVGDGKPENLAAIQASTDPLVKRMGKKLGQMFP